MAQLELDLLALGAPLTITTGIVDASYQLQTKTTTAQRPQRECRQRKRPYDPSETDQLPQHHIKRTKSNNENERLSKSTDENQTNTNSFRFIKQATICENNHHESNELINGSSGSIINSISIDDEQTCDSLSSEIQSDSEDKDTPIPTVHDKADENSDNNDDELSNDSDEQQRNKAPPVQYFSKISTDQRPFISVLNKPSEQLSSYPKHLRKQIKRFHYLYDHGLRKSIEPTRVPETDDNEITVNETNDHTDYLTTKWELRNTFNRLDLFKEGYSVLSNEQFPFYSLCYMCGSVGNDLIYCNCCCEAYHCYCLNELERPKLFPIPDSWLCPNCNVCNICGLSGHTTNTLIACAECKKNYHLKCIKRGSNKYEQNQEQITINNNQNPTLKSSSSSCSTVFFRNQTWYCPRCIKCDCGQLLTCTERNLFSSFQSKSVISQQSMMCKDCLTNLKLMIGQNRKYDDIEKCHLCEKFIEQMITKQQHKQETSQLNLMQCQQCKNRFHPKCDGYLVEDCTLIGYIKSICFNIVCSKCNSNERDNIKRLIIDYKLQVIKSIIQNISSTISIMLNDTSNSPQRYLCRLQQLHESRGQSLNLHAFLNDLLIIVQRLLAQINIRRWQAAIDGCIVRQCPWFKTTFNNNQQLYYSIDSSSNHHSPLLPPPTQDHNYSLTNENYLMNLSSNYTSSESLIKYIDQDNTTYGDFTNLYQLDTRKCELCQTYSDRLSPPNIGRLISIGFKQWVHVGCILAAYSSQKLSPLDEPPYILRNIKDIIKQCQSKYTCHMCHKQGATVMCCEQDCNIRYHCDCIQKHYAQQQQIPSLNLVNGTLANLQTYCIKHYKKMNGETTTNDQIERISTETKQTNLSSNNIPIKPVKSINLSSTVYGDLNRELIGLNLDDLNLCIGSLQIHSIGNYDLLLDDDFDSDDCESNSSDNDDGSDEPTISKHLKLSHIYPNDYHSSRLYWSTKCAKNMTVYHLYISCESNYHNIRENHHNYEHGTSAQERQQIIHEQCQQYFKQLQMKIDEHRKEVKILSSSSTDKTTTHQQKQTSNIQLNKEKKKANNNNNVQKKTRELMSSASYENTSSVVKRQTPKSAIQNIRRPRDKNQCQKPSTKINHRPSPNINNKNYSNDIDSDKFNHRNSLTMKASNHYCHKVYSPNKTKEVMSVDFKTLQHLLPNISNREMSPSPFAILLAKALQQIQPTTLAIGPQPQASLSHAPILSYYLSSQQPNKDDNNNNNNINNINNNHKQQQHSSTNTVASDQLLQHLWKTMNSSKKHNESSQNQQPSKTSSTSHWRHMQQPNPLKKLQTNNDRIVQSNPQQTVDVVDLKIKSYQQIDQVDHQIKNHQLDTIDCLCVSENNKESSPIVLEADSVLLTDIVLSNKHKQNEQFPKDCLPQLDGCFDVDIDHNNDVDIDDVSQIIESLLDQIDQTNRQRSTSEHSLDLNGEYQLLDLNIELTPISPTKLHHQSPKKEQKCHKLSEDEIIEEYKRWKKSKYVQVKFRIQSDDGYEILSDDLNQAWATIVNLVRETRDDMKLTHLPLTLYDGHDAFGLNKTIVKTLLKQLQICTIKNYFQTQTTKKPLNESSSISPVQLPLSTSSSSSLKSMKMIVKQNEWYRKLILYKKQLKKQHRQYSKTTIYERKSHKRQRFGWLLNPSRKISYAKQTFEIDDALIHSRRIILEEASVSLRLYHLHYFSARCLLVGHSPIHGCGLFTLIDILEGQMIIEYSGEVIRPCLTDKRERENEGKGFGCYMFTVDSMHVIDATHRGNKARFINHSCEPNCFSKTVLCGGIKRIIIYALKDIQSGKELTYDYSFPEEDVKIPCCCRTDNCRLYLN